MAATIEVKCQQCRTPFIARVADRKRGWGRFCSKSCKAVRQEKRTGQYANYAYNFQGSGVSRETYMHYQREHGGIPQFNRHGEYEGFLSGGFDNTQHQNNDPNESNTR